MEGKDEKEKRVLKKNEAMREGDRETKRNTAVIQNYICNQI